MIDSLMQECLLELDNSWHKNNPRLDSAIHLAKVDGSVLAALSMIFIIESLKKYQKSLFYVKSVFSSIFKKLIDSHIDQPKSYKKPIGGCTYCFEINLKLLFFKWFASSCI